MTIPRRSDFPITTSGSTPPDRIVSIWEDDNPNSILNKIGNVNFTAAAKKAKSDFPELFVMPEDKLFKELRFRLQQPSSTDHAIRLRLWMEYEDSLQTKHRCRLERTYGSFMETTFFYEKYTKSPTVMAWMLCPPTAYNVKIEEALHAGVNQMREILDKPLEDASGKFNVKLAELQVKVYALLDARVNGGFKQTIEQKNLNVHVGRGSITQQALTMEEIDKRLKHLAGEDKYQAKLKQKEPVLVENEESAAGNE